VARKRPLSNVLKWFAIAALVGCSIYIAVRVVALRSDLGAEAQVDNIVDSYHGCPVFPNVYGQIVTNAPTDPNSTADIASVQRVDKGTFVASTGNQQVNFATSVTPLLTVMPDVHYHEFPVPYPWQLGFWIKPLSDAHAMPEDLASGCAFVYPASATDQLPYSGNSTYQLPYGARIRLNANGNPTRCTREARMVVTALKTFGAFAADTGGQDALYFANNTTGGDPWSGRLRCLSALTIADFVVLKLPKIQRIPGH
jgi:hypothetical protein